MTSEAPHRPGVRASLREATRRTLRASRLHLAYGGLVAASFALVLGPAISWVGMASLDVAAGGSVVNTDLAKVLLSVRGAALVILWGSIAGLLVVVAVAGHVYIAAAEGLGMRPSLRGVLRHVAADLLRVPGRGGMKIAALVTIGLPVIAAFGSALAGLLLLPFGRGAALRDVVPRGLPVPLWTVATGMAALLLLFGWLGVRWSLAIPILALEGTSLTEATRRSVARVRGAFWSIALGHLAHQVAVALAYAAIVGVTRVACRPLVAALLERDAGAVGLAILLVVFYVISTGLWVLATARLVSLLVVHHLARGGAILWDAAFEAAEVSPRVRARAAILAVAAASTLAVAAWLTVPRVHAEMERLARPTLVTAHRGASIAAPENTIAALRQAHADGADMAEIDVQQAAGGALVVLHDANLRRLAGVDANVWDLDLAALGRLDVGAHHSSAFAGERIPTLADAIRFAKSAPLLLNVEIKVHGRETDSFVPDLVALLRREEFVDRCVVTSLDAASLRRVRAEAPEIKIGVIVTARLGPVHDLDVDLYSVQPLVATSAFIRKAHALCRDVHVWTVNDAADVARFADRAADAVITDLPRQARSVLDARGPADGLRAVARRLFGLD